MSTNWQSASSLVGHKKMVKDIDRKDSLPGEHFNTAVSLLTQRPNRQNESAARVGDPLHVKLWRKWTYGILFKVVFTLLRVFVCDICIIHIKTSRMPLIITKTLKCFFARACDACHILRIYCNDVPRM